MSGPRYRALLAGEPVTPGQPIADFHGKAWTFAYVTAGPVSFGKIIVTDAGGSGQREFFPNVFPGLSVEPVDPPDDED
jgi:hypothetical protein